MLEIQTIVEKEVKDCPITGKASSENIKQATVKSIVSNIPKTLLSKSNAFI